MGQLTQQFQQLSQRVRGLEAALGQQGSADLAALLRTVQVRQAACRGLARRWGWLAGCSAAGCVLAGNACWHSSAAGRCPVAHDHAAVCVSRLRLQDNEREKLRLTLALHTLKSAHAQQRFR